jgi:hypothetical protein
LLVKNFSIGRGKIVKLNIFIKSVILCVTALFFVFGGLPVAMAARNDVVEFPDAHLQQALIDAGADEDMDGELTEGELAALTGAVDLSGKAIGDITGLSFAAGITELDLSGNAILDITELSELTSLQALDLSDNLVGDISALSDLDGLASLNLSGNELFEIDALYNVDAPPDMLALQTLDVSVNYLNVADGSDDRKVTDALILAGCAVIFDPQKPIPVSGIKLNLNESGMCPGDTAALSATVLPTDAVVQDYTWQSSNEDVATVEGGTVKALSIGTAVITVTTLDGAKTDTCVFTVSDGMLTSPVYQPSGSLLRGVARRTTVEQFKNSFLNSPGDIRVYESGGGEYTGVTVLTGLTVKLAVGGIERDEKTIIVAGDVNGDGLVTLKDYALVQLHLSGEKTLEPPFVHAGDFDNDGQLTEADSESMREAVLQPAKEGSALPDLPVVSDERIRSFLDVALAQRGKPYVWGARGPKSFDCSGFVYYSLRKSGYKLDRLTADMYSRNKKWKYVDKDSLQPGDLMFYYTDDKNDGDHVGHIGIYLGNGYHVHASSDYGCVIICGVQGWYKSALAFGRRVYD